MPGCPNQPAAFNQAKTMSRLTTRDASELEPETLESLEPVKIGGAISDVYLQFANSETALRTYLQMESTLRQGSLSDLELEAIKLLVSEKNQCDFCLSVHDMKARKLGMDTESRRAVRRAESIDNPRIDAIAAIVDAFFTYPGPLDDAMVERARAAGLTDRELVDVGMAVATIFFTNIVNHVNDTQPALPPAPSVTD